MKVMVIGNPEAVRGFSLVGVDGKAATNADEVNRALDESLATGDVGIILITMDMARLIEQRMDHLKLRSTIPLVVEIPGPEGVPEGQPSLGDVVLRAIGIRI